MYDASADGQRFLMIKTGAPVAGTAAPVIVVLQHRVDESKRLVKD